MMVSLEIRGRIVSFPRAQLERAQALAAAEAGVSSGLRDLALVLDWALNSSRVVALRRSEARELEQLARLHQQLDGIAAALAELRGESRAAEKRRLAAPRAHGSCPLGERVGDGQGLDRPRRALVRMSVRMTRFGAFRRPQRRLGSAL